MYTGGIKCKSNLPLMWVPLPQLGEGCVGLSMKSASQSSDSKHSHPPRITWLITSDAAFLFKVAAKCNKKKIIRWRSAKIT